MCKKISAALKNDCTVKPVVGVKSGVIINYEDVDWAALTETDSTLTTLPLKSGTQGYPVTWLKRMSGSTKTFVASATEREGFTHSWAAQIAEYSAASAEVLSELQGGRFLLVVESNFIGAAGVDSYKVFGRTAGLYLTEALHADNENGGAITYVLSTLEGDLESYIYNTYLENDLATSKANYDTQFAVA